MEEKLHTSLISDGRTIQSLSEALLKFCNADFISIETLKAPITRLRFMHKKHIQSDITRTYFVCETYMVYVML
jgi:hypothetical protein